MAGLNRRFRLTAIALGVLFLAIAGLAHANEITVNTTDGGSEPYPLCTLQDAVTAHNIQLAVHGCAAGSGGDDDIDFAVTGEIFIDDTLEITNGTLSIFGPDVGGIAINGGGSIEILKLDASSTVSLFDLTFSHGAVTGFDSSGGAIFADGSFLSIVDCTFDHNSADPSAGFGGAIFTFNGRVEITNSTFADNSAGHGGAVYNNGGATVFLTNDTFSSNTEGGAIDGGSLNLKGVLLAGNTGGNCPGPTPTDLNYNISSDNTCSFSAGSSLNSTDPKLDPAGLQNNGGPTDTIALQGTSPAIDRIPVADCTDQQTTPEPLLTDQRLYGRPDPANLNFCDSGAYEIHAVAPIVLNSERLQIARSSSPSSDQVNMGLIFTDNGVPTCDSGDNALNGLEVALTPGSCEDIPDSFFDLTLDPFVVHTVNHQSYGTFYASDPDGAVSARIVALPTPAGSCGQWSLNIETSGLDTEFLGNGPYALLIANGADKEGCFDITNAIVGSQIPKVVIPVVRRGARR
jgi:hypothetical protein